MSDADKNAETNRPLPHLWELPLEFIMPELESAMERSRLGLPPLVEEPVWEPWYLRWLDRLITWLRERRAA